MTRPRGGYIGFNRVPAATAASGVWTLREAEALKREGTWPMALLLDGIGAGAEFAFSLKRLSTPYTGNAAKLRRSNDNAESDFTPEEFANGVAAAWVGSGNTGFVTTWYDQTGNGRTFTQSTAARQPSVSFSTMSVVFPEIPGAVVPAGTGDHPNLINTNITITSNAFTYLSVVELTARNDARNKYQRILSCRNTGQQDYDSNNGFLLTDTPDNGANGLVTYRSGVIASLPTLSLNVKTVAGMRLDGTSMTALKNTDTNTGTTSATAVNVNEVRIGNNAEIYDSGLAGRYYVGIGFKSALTDSAMLALSSFLSTNWQV